MKPLVLCGLLICVPVLAWQNQTGAIEVQVRLGEQTPELPVVVVDKNIPFCGEKIKDPILLTNQGSVINSVVYVNWSGEAAPAKQANLTLKTEGCLIKPRVQTARTGAFLHLNSSDNITHNPHGWLDNKRTVFTRGQFMNRPRAQFFASARLTQNHDGSFSGCIILNILFQILHTRTIT